jgi:hypothetical protein
MKINSFLLLSKDPRPQLSVNVPSNNKRPKQVKKSFRMIHLEDGARTPYKWLELDLLRRQGERQK